MDFCNPPQGIPELSFSGHRCKGFWFKYRSQYASTFFPLSGWIDTLLLALPAAIESNTATLARYTWFADSVRKVSARYYFLGFAGLWVRVSIPRATPQGIDYALIAHKPAQFH